MCDEVYGDAGPVLVWDRKGMQQTVLALAICLAALASQTSANILRDVGCYP